jgi:site-specific DNA recombinase
MNKASGSVMATVPLRAVLYCRVSSAGQEDNSSLETQEQRCRAHAAERGWEVVAVFREVHTGSELFERPQLSRLRETLRGGGEDIVLAYALDRVSRNQAHLGFLLSEWDHLGVRLELVTEAFDETPEGRLLQSVRGFVAEMERLKIRERTQRGIRSRAENGSLLAGPRPLYGYAWRDGKKSALDINPETASVVQRIFLASLGGETLRCIAAKLSAEAVPTPTGRNTQWAVTTVRRILSTPQYTGQAVAFRWQSERREGRKRTSRRPVDEQLTLPEGTIPALVAQKEFAAVAIRLEANQRMAVRNNRDPEASLLRTGFVRCGYCGSPLTVKNPSPSRPGDRHYRCGTVNRDRFGCPAARIQTRQLDQAVWDRVVLVLTRPEIIAAEVERRRGQDRSATEIITLDRRLAEIAARRQRLARAISLLDDEEASAALLQETMALTDQQRVLTAERGRMAMEHSESRADQERLGDLAAWCERVAGNLDSLAYEERRMILGALGVEVKLFRSDHDPRWEVTMTPSPEPPSSSPIVFRTASGLAGMASSFSLARRPAARSIATSGATPGSRSRSSIRPTPIATSRSGARSSASILTRTTPSSIAWPRSTWIKRSTPGTSPAMSAS